MLYHQLLVPVLSLLLLLLGTHQVSCASQPARSVCYFSSRAATRPGLGRYGLEDIPYHLCTHIIYSFIGVNETDYEVYMLDPKYYLVENIFNRLAQLRQKHPHLKLEIGVDVLGAQKLSSVIGNRHRRLTFISSLVNFMKNYDFDGVDIYWAFPFSTPRDVDKDYFLYFVQELRRAVDREKRDWEITMTASLIEDKINRGYHVLELCEILDAVYTIGFLFHTHAEYILDSARPLHKRKHDKSPFEKSNVNDGLMLWEEKGCPANKLVLAISFDGITFGINEPISSYHIGTAKKKNGGGLPGPYTKSTGLLAYYEICTELPSGGLKVEWDDEGMVPYAYNTTLWVSYENATSVQTKMDFIKAKGYAGAMSMQIDTDDFHGLCGTKNILLETIYDNMKNYNVPNTKPNTTTIELPTASPIRVVQANDKTITLEPEPKPRAGTSGIVLPHPDPQKYYLNLNGKLVEFECKKGTEFNSLKNMCVRTPNDSPILRHNGTNIFYVNNFYIYEWHQ